MQILQCSAIVKRDPWKVRKVEGMQPTCGRSSA